MQFMLKNSMYNIRDLHFPLNPVVRRGFRDERNRHKETLLRLEDSVNTPEDELGRFRRELNHALENLRSMRMDLPRWAENMKSFNEKRFPDDTFGEDEDKAFVLDCCRSTCLGFVRALWRRLRSQGASDDQVRNSVQNFDVRAILTHILPMDQMNAGYVLERDPGDRMSRGLLWFAHSQRETLLKNYLYRGPIQWYLARPRALHNVHVRRNMGAGSQLPPLSDTIVLLVMNPKNEMEHLQFYIQPFMPKYCVQNYLDDVAFSDLVVGIVGACLHCVGLLALVCWLGALLFVLPLSEIICAPHCGEWRLFLTNAVFAFPLVVDVKNALGLENSAFASVPVVPVGLVLVCSMMITLWLSSTLPESDAKASLRHVFYLIGILLVVGKTGFQVVDVSCVFVYTLSAVIGLLKLIPILSEDRVGVDLALNPPSIAVWGIGVTVSMATCACLGRRFTPPLLSLTLTLVGLIFVAATSLSTWQRTLLIVFWVCGLLRLGYVVIYRLIRELNESLKFLGWAVSKACLRIVLSS